MNVSPQQAADALRDIEQTEEHSRELAGYRRWAPILFLWGAISVLGYGAMGLSFRYNILWLPLLAVGTGVTIIFARRVTRDVERAAFLSRRVGLTWAAMMLLYVATFALVQPKMPTLFTPFPGLVIGTTYMLMGVWIGKRYAVLGFAIFALTMIGLYGFNWYRELVSSEWPATYFAFWMAGVMGGGLILGGLWLRKA